MPALLPLEWTCVYIFSLPPLRRLPVCHLVNLYLYATLRRKPNTHAVLVLCLVLAGGWLPSVQTFLRTNATEYENIKCKIFVHSLLAVSFCLTFSLLHSCSLSLSWRNEIEYIWFKMFLVLSTIKYLQFTLNLFLVCCCLLKCDSVT
jgi:hypothetical protein